MKPEKPDRWDPRPGFKPSLPVLPQSHFLSPRRPWYPSLRTYLTPQFLLPFPSQEQAWAVRWQRRCSVGDVPVVSFHFRIALQIPCVFCEGPGRSMSRRRLHLLQWATLRPSTTRESISRSIHVEAMAMSIVKIKHTSVAASPRLTSDAFFLRLATVLLFAMII